MENKEQIDSIQDDIRVIKDALIGNDYGNKGIVKRLECVEKQSNATKKTLSNIKTTSTIMGTAAGGGIYGMIEAIKQLFINN